MSEMSLNQFQRLNVDRNEKHWKELDWPLERWILCMVGEAGEAANAMKKILRGDNVPLDAVINEIGDVLAYASLACTAAGVTLEDCAMRKFNEVSGRVGYPLVRFRSSRDAVGGP